MCGVDFTRSIFTPEMSDISVTIVRWYDVYLSMTQILVLAMEQIYFCLTLFLPLIRSLSIYHPNQLWPNWWLCICHGYQPRTTDRSSILKLIG